MGDDRSSCGSSCLGGVANAKCVSCSTLLQLSRELSGGFSGKVVVEILSWR